VVKGCDIMKFCECQQCKKKFKIGDYTAEYITKYKIDLFCPKCNSTNIGFIDRKQYENASIFNGSITC
jgi:hypothetical protein